MMQVLCNVDREAIAHAGYGHPAQQGSWSIKMLARALLLRGYDDLETGSGMATVLALSRAIRAEGVVRETLGRGFRDYCGRDATLMRAIVQSLTKLAGEA